MLGLVATLQKLLELTDACGRAWDNAYAPGVTVR
jgi:hypothetical protein